MKTYLVLYGKPRYLGILTLEDAVEIPKNAEIVVRTSRGEDAALCCGLLSPDALARLGQTLPPPSREEGQEPGARELRPVSTASEPEEHAAAKANASNTSRHPKEDFRGAPRNGGENDLEEVLYVGPLEETHRQLRVALREEESDALREARVMLRGHKLDMKLVDVEYPLDRKKIFLYFTSEQRVDFRGYVRDLAKIFKTRIELRQIGIRDEAKVAGGIAPCGLQCCCSRWLHRFAPICIRMVKEQNLALNPVKISGLCGRLMCCMGYEYATYHELWEHLPNPGAKVRGSRAVYSVSGVDLATQSVRLYGEGQEVSVPVSEFSTFKKNLAEGIPWVPEDAAVPLPDRRHDGDQQNATETTGSSSSRRPEGKRGGERPGGHRIPRQENSLETSPKKEGKGGNLPASPADATAENLPGDRRPPRGEKGNKKAKTSGHDAEKKSPSSRSNAPKPSSPSHTPPAQGGTKGAPSLQENADGESTWGGDNENIALPSEKKRRRKRRRSGPKPDATGENLSENGGITEKNLPIPSPRGEKDLPRGEGSKMDGEGARSASGGAPNTSPEEGKTPTKRKRHRPRHRKTAPSSGEAPLSVDENRTPE